MSEQLRCGGQWLSTIGQWGDLEWSHAADGGCKEASWKMTLSPRFSHPALTPGKIVQVKDGPWDVWRGVMIEPDLSDEDVTFHAVGLSSLGNSNYLALDGSGNSTTNPNTAVDAAIARGLPWTRLASLSGTSFGDADAPTYLGALLTAWSTSASRRWGVNAQGEVYAALDPTVPTWYLAPNAGRLGLADDDYASSLFLRYTSSTGFATAVATDANAAAKFGVREVPVDITSHGLLIAAQATNYGTGLLVKGKARMGYTNGISVNKYQLTTPGGTPADLRMVKGQQLVRQFGLLDAQGDPVPYFDWVIGETSYQAGADTIGLTPVGLVGRTLTDVLAEISQA